MFAYVSDKLKKMDRKKIKKFFFATRFSVAIRMLRVHANSINY
jgi:hypothetical protein